MPADRGDAACTVAGVRKPSMKMLWGGRRRGYCIRSKPSTAPIPSPQRASGTRSRLPDLFVDKAEHASELVGRMVTGNALLCDERLVAPAAHYAPVWQPGAPFGELDPGAAGIRTII